MIQSWMRSVYASLCCGLCICRITKMLIEQDGPGWREKLPEIPAVPLAVQQQHQQKPLSAEAAEARAARAAMEEGRWRRFLRFREAVMDLKPSTDSDVGQILHRIYK